MAKQIILDKSDPEIADAFQGCKPGDMYKVVSDDDSQLVLEAATEPDAEESGEGDAAGTEESDATAASADTGYGGGNPAVKKMMARKMAH
jgi:hypothetical protein